MHNKTNGCLEPTWTMEWHNDNMALKIYSAGERKTAKGKQTLRFSTTQINQYIFHLECAAQRHSAKLPTNFGIAITFLMSGAPRFGDVQRKQWSADLGAICKWFNYANAIILYMFVKCTQMEYIIACRPFRFAAIWRFMGAEQYSKPSCGSCMTSFFAAAHHKEPVDEQKVLSESGLWTFAPKYPSRMWYFIRRTASDSKCGHMINGWT